MFTLDAVYKDFKSFDYVEIIIYVLPVFHGRYVERRNSGLNNTACFAFGCEEIYNIRRTWYAEGVDRKEAAAKMSKAPSSENIKKVAIQKENYLAIFYEFDQVGNRISRFITRLSFCNLAKDGCWLCCYRFI